MVYNLPGYNHAAFRPPLSPPSGRHLLLSIDGTERSARWLSTVFSVGDNTVNVLRYSLKFF